MVRVLTTCACATLILVGQARADHHEGKSSGTSTSSQASGSKGNGPGNSAMKAEDTGTRQGDPGILPDSVEEDRAVKTQRPQAIIGTVKELDKDRITVQSTPLSDPHRLTMSPDTKFVRDGRTISRDQLDEGDMVRAMFLGEGDSGRATEIEVIQDKKEQPKMSAPQGQQGMRPSNDEKASQPEDQSRAR